ncbi:hypothetical protein [Bradyrhizobium genosp. P]|uniref:hypothetical protein n=1 Tax=Bradyrhizobium genosp. P TaxID=83641 RepID=UPI003CE689F5
MYWRERRRLPIKAQKAVRASHSDVCLLHFFWSLVAILLVALLWMSSCTQRRSMSGRSSPQARAVFSALPKPLADSASTKGGHE